MADDTSESPKCPSGLPPWMATFADMMTLLLCFFVLLTSTSVQDAKKYKAMVESMRKALGVTTEISIDQTQLVTSGIANEFIAAQTAPKAETESIEQLKEKALQATLTEIKNQGEKIKEDLGGEIGKGLITVDIKGLQIVMRIEEKGSFTSGSAMLKPGFEPVMDKITDSIKQAKGNIRVAGHTDDVPITTSSYRSNWELSSSRAVTVAQYMLADKGVSAGRIAIEGYADTKPLLPNDSAENRAKNRRVEIILVQEDPTLGLDTKKPLVTGPSIKPE